MGGVIDGGINGVQCSGVNVHVGNDGVIIAVMTVAVNGYIC